MTRAQIRNFSIGLVSTVATSFFMIPCDAFSEQNTLVIGANDNTIPVPVTVKNDNVNVAKFVFFNTRIEPDDVEFYHIPNPEKYILIITDIVIQNRAPGDGPVDPNAHSRLSTNGIKSNDSGGNYALTVVGNQTLDLHFQTGIPVEYGLQFGNVGSSTAPFVEIIATGYLTQRP